MENLGALQPCNHLTTKTEQSLPYPIWHLKGIQLNCKAGLFQLSELIDALCQTHVKMTQ